MCGYDLAPWDSSFFSFLFSKIEFPLNERIFDERLHGSDKITYDVSAIAKGDFRKWFLH